MANQLCQSSESGVWKSYSPDPLLRALGSGLGEPNYEQSGYKANCTHSQPALYIPPFDVDPNLTPSDPVPRLLFTYG